MTNNKILNKKRNNYQVSYQWLQLRIKYLETNIQQWGTMVYLEMHSEMVNSLSLT